MARTACTLLCHRTWRKNEERKNAAARGTVRGGVGIWRHFARHFACLATLTPPCSNACLCRAYLHFTQRYAPRAAVAANSIRAGGGLSLQPRAYRLLRLNAFVLASRINTGWRPCCNGRAKNARTLNNMRG